MKKGVIAFYAILSIIILIMIFLIIRNEKIDISIEPNMNTDIIYLPKNEESENNSTRVIEKVSMDIKERTLTKTGVTIIITDDNEKPYEYSQWFMIEKKQKDEWIPLKPIDKNHIDYNLALIYRENKNLEYEIDWTKLYGKLKKGNYRLIKRVYDNEYKYFWVEFTIN